jgi:hypothetical protein
MNRRAVFTKLILVFTLVWQAQTAFAAVSISEIMYKPNPNSGHEWVELYNSGADAVDFTYTTSKHWKIAQNASEGGIKPFQGGNNLPAGGYVVLAVDPSLFLADHPDWAGLLFDITSLTSLNDTSATLTLTDISGVVQDTVSYVNTQGASGDGNSLQKIAGSWSAVSSTPGIANESTTPVVSQDVVATTVVADSATPASTPVSSANSSFPVDPQIFADAGAHIRTVSVGATVTFSGRVWGLKKEPIENARMEWAFGDGAMATGATVSHVYYYPGEYTVVLESASGYYSASDRARVIAVTPAVAIHSGGDGARSFIAIENFGNEELDLSNWQIVAEGKKFILPKNTLIVAHKTLTLASEISGLSTSSSTVATLHFPNGALVPPPGTPVPTEVKTSPINNVPTEVTQTTIATGGRASRAPTRVAAFAQPSQSAPETLSDQGADLAPVAQESPLWMWYVGIALFGALAAVGLRFGRKTEPASAEITADDFEIIEENPDSL